VAVDFRAAARGGEVVVWGGAGVWVHGGVALHLVVAEDEVLEGVDVGDLGEAVAVGFDKVGDEGFDVFALDELEELEAGGVEEVVARHGFVDDGEDGVEEVVFYDLRVVEFVLEVDALTEEFERGC
jgi:hypothetical protein